LKPNSKIHKSTAAMKTVIEAQLEQGLTVERIDENKGNAQQ
jgi:uncharacterized protein YqgV (UPF0045/DUF77 family)